MLLRRLRNIIATTAIATAFCAPAQNHAPAVINVSADSTQITMGGRTIVHVEVVKNSHEGVYIDGMTRQADSLGNEIMFLGPTEVRQLSADSADIGNGRTQVSYNYMVQPFDVGTASFGPFKFVANGDTTYSQTISIKVLEPDIPKVMRDSLWINPMETVVSIPSRWYDYVPEWWPWVIVALFVIALAILVVILYRRNGPTLIPIHKKVIPPYPLAIKRLELLKSRHLAESGHVKEYYTELTDILRQYLQGRFGVYAREMTSPQILAACEPIPELATFIPRLKDLLTTADFVKFAKLDTGVDENIRSYNDVRAVVEGTKPVEEPKPVRKSHPHKGRKNKKKK